MTKTLFMLDTDTCSYIIRGTSESLKKKVKKNRNHLCISSITLAELLFGAAKKSSPRLYEAIDLFQQLVDVKHWSDTAAAEYALIRKSLEESGTTIGNMDMLIAASAKAEKCCLVTNNIAHFSRIKNLRFENWLKT